MPLFKEIIFVGLPGKNKLFFFSKMKKNEYNFEEKETIS
jgi:hypothetical protein